MIQAYKYFLNKRYYSKALVKSSKFKSVCWVLLHKQVITAPLLLEIQALIYIQGNGFSSADPPCIAFPKSPFWEFKLRPTSNTWNLELGTPMQGILQENTSCPCFKGYFAQTYSHFAWPECKTREQRTVFQSILLAYLCQQKQKSHFLISISTFTHFSVITNSKNHVASEDNLL